MAGIGAAYYVTGRLGLLIGVLNAQISPLWPPAGIALVALLVVGVRVWPGILVGSILVKAALMPALPAVLSGTGSMLGPMCAYLLLRRVGFSTNLDRQRDALALVLLGAFAAMLVSATVGTVVEVVAGVIPSRDFFVGWFTWWTGDAMGVLAFAPSLLLLFRRSIWHRKVTWRRGAEAGALLVGGFICVLESVRILGAAFVAFPFVGWTAVRFRLAGAAPVGLIASTIDTVASVRRIGPIPSNDLLMRMVTLQLFNGSITLGGLFLAITLMERDRARQTIEQTLARLREVIDHLDQSTTTPKPAVDTRLPDQPGNDSDRRPHD